MGGLLGEPLELVKCETSDVFVPADAEIRVPPVGQKGQRNQLPKLSQALEYPSLRAFVSLW